MEFIARSSNAQHVIAAMVLDRLQEALSSAGDLRETLRAEKIQYLLSDNGEWEFNYLLTDNGAVIGTEKSFDRRTTRIELLNKSIATKPEQVAVDQD